MDQPQDLEGLNHGGADQDASLASSRSVDCRHALMIRP